MRCGAVVVAAGRSQRMGANKTMISLAGRAVILRVLDALAALSEISETVLVTNAENLSEVELLLDDEPYERSVELCLGGETRQESVRHGVESLSDDLDLVLIHDAARALVTPELLRSTINSCEQSGAVIAAIPVTDTIKLVEADDVISRTLDRTMLYAAQTPQVFRRDWLIDAYHKARDQHSSTAFTDEASLLEWAGYQVRVVAGSDENIKLTRPFDLTLAESILAARVQAPS